MHDDTPSSLNLGSVFTSVFLEAVHSFSLVGAHQVEWEKMRIRNKEFIFIFVLHINISIYTNSTVHGLYFTIFVDKRDSVYLQLNSQSDSGLFLPLSQARSWLWM